MRIAYVTSHPIQYQAPLFRELTGRPNVTFKAFFAWDSGVKETHDPGFGRSVLWDVPLLDGYDHTFVPNLAKRPGVTHFSGLVNPGIFQALKRFAPDAIIVHGYAHATEHFAMIAGRILRVPVLIRGESNLLPTRSRLTRIAKRLGSSYLRSILAGALSIGTHSRDYFRHYGFAEDRIFLAPYAVDNTFFQSRGEEARVVAAQWRTAAGIAADDIVFGFAAKLSKVKACGDLIEAFGRAALPKTALYIVGDGVLRQQLETQAKSFPGAKIHFHGFVNQSEMPTAYAISDVFILPSNYEPWGLGINEAMNLARPVVVSEAVSCSVDLIGPDNGWVFKVGDIDGLIEVLTEASNCREELVTMGLASLARINRWGLSDTANGIIHAVDTITKNR